MELLKERIMQTACSDSTVLIYGETGTGKELVAQALHAGSKRGGRRFLSQNCAAIPENLLESILFGTVKGGFTNAENHMGLFEAANGGTLFLDEVNSMDLSVQAKLLQRPGRSKDHADRQYRRNSCRCQDYRRDERTSQRLCKQWEAEGRPVLPP